MLSLAYRLLTDLGAPVLGLYLRRRKALGREDAARFRERLGIASLACPPTPDGSLIWCHAASIGEATSALALIERLRALYPARPILMTTGTVTSARLMETRLPPGAFHQYMPVDRAPYIRRFLDHWNPGLALWIESELWPNALAALRTRQIPAILLNGRMSERSFRRWRFAKGWARELLHAFALCLTQTEAERARFATLGARSPLCLGNLKYAAAPLPCDEAELARLRGMIADRPLWLMASTHRGEEALALAAHQTLAAAHPSLLTVILPRHAARGDEAEALLREGGIPLARRSRHDAIAPSTGLYLADTMGESGLFYRLCPIAVIGGSFAPLGGHNPIEPAQLGAVPVFGPSMHNFSEVAEEFLRRKAALGVESPDGLAPVLGSLLSSPETRGRLAKASRDLAAEKRRVLDDILDVLAPWLDNQGAAP